MGLALLELFAATGRGEFLDGGRAAFAYEDRLFDPQRGNWPDLRPYPPGHSLSALRYKTAWCYGAAGIGLARLRAAALDPQLGEAYLEMARAAFRTTAAAFPERDRLPRADACLCHGLAGRAEALLVAAECLGDEGWLAWAREAGARLIARHGERGDWPSGVACRGPNPSLMLGTAGIGHHFLRLHDPARTPPVLLVL
jgi:lantibiotic modifying enzyme